MLGSAADVGGIAGKGREAPDLRTAEPDSCTIGAKPEGILNDRPALKLRLRFDVGSATQ